MSPIISPAHVDHVDAITKLVNSYAEQNITLPRTEESVRQTLDDWLVAVEPDEQNGHPMLVGCGALVPLTNELVEVRSLAIAEGQQGKGVGAKIVNQLVEMARQRGFKQVCALTLTEGFFLKLGFDLVDRWSISPKVWQACIYCPKFHRCDEVAVLMHLDNESTTEMKTAEPINHPAWANLLKWEEWQPLKLAYKQEQQEQDLRIVKPENGKKT